MEGWSVHNVGSNIVGAGKLDLRSGWLLHVLGSHPSGWRSEVTRVQDEL